MEEPQEGPKAGQGRSTLRRLVRVVGRCLDGLAVLVRVAWAGFKRVVVIGLILGLLGAKIATIAIAPFQRLVSAGFEVVTGATSVNKQLRNQVAVSEERLRVEQAKTTRLSKTVKTQEAALGKARAELQTSKQAIARQGKEVKTINQRMAGRTVKSATLNFDSLVPMAVPAVGIAVILAVTAADLKWSCDNLKDLRALELAFDAEATQNEQESRVCGLKLPTKGELIAKAASLSDWIVMKTDGLGATVASYLPSMSWFRLPSLTMPEFAMPELSMPSLPAFDLPKFKLPW